MKLASYTVSGRASHGVVEGDGVIDIGRQFAARASSLRAAIAAGALTEIADMARGAKPDVALAEVELLPPLWMKEGDTVEVEISRIGVLRNKVVAEM